MSSRKLVDYLVITLKGMAMGVAELVPGVSGGTIAFVAGIYEEFISSINNFNLKTFQILRKDGFKSTWIYINGDFLIALLLGMVISIISFSKLVSWLLENEPIPLWSFFFGLVIASMIIVLKAIKKWNLLVIVAFIIGTITAYYITTLPPSQNSESLPFIFLSGSIAICAMILPGISGSFILVLLGSYKVILDAVHERDFKVLITTALGCLFGILTFAKLLKWMFKSYRNTTLALLTGFILGSLNKIWPWKKVLATKVFGDKTKVIDEQSILPSAFDGDPKLILALGLAITGFSLIFILERIASKK